MYDEFLNAQVHRQSGTSLYAPEEGVTEAQLLDLLQRRAQLLATPPPEEAAGKMLDLLLFTLHNERYAVPVPLVSSIHRLPIITPVPRTPDFVLGVFGTRGRLVTAVDLAIFLQLPPTELGTTSKIIIVGDAHPTIESGLVVDDVLDVITIAKQDLNPPLATQDDYRAKFTQGITDNMLVLLNLDALLNDPRFIIREMGTFG